MCINWVNIHFTQMQYEKRLDGRLKRILNISFSLEKFIRYSDVTFYQYFSMLRFEMMSSDVLQNR